MDKQPQAQEQQQPQAQEQQQPQAQEQQQPQEQTKTQTQQLVDLFKLKVRDMDLSYSLLRSCFVTEAFVDNKNQQQIQKYIQIISELERNFDNCLDILPQL